VFRLIMEYSADDPVVRMTLGKVRSTCYGQVGFVRSGVAGQGGTQRCSRGDEANSGRDQLSRDATGEVGERDFRVNTHDAISDSVSDRYLR